MGGIKREGMRNRTFLPLLCDVPCIAATGPKINVCILLVQWTFEPELQSTMKRGERGDHKR